MKCPSCNEEVKIWASDEGTNSYELVDAFKADVIAKYGIPFTCQICGSFQIPYEPVRDVIFLWKPELPENVGSIIIPEYEGRQGNARELLLRDNTAIVLACGPGVLSKRGVWVPCLDIKFGDRIAFNKNVPWFLRLPGWGGKEYKITLCGYQDIYAKVLEG